MAEDNANKLLTKLETVSTVREYADRIASTAESMPEQPPQKLRRLAKKSVSHASRGSSTDTPLASQDTYRTRRTSLSVEYRYTLEPDFRSRRIVQGVGAQSCPRRLLAIIAPHTVDLDIENCCFCLSLQILDKLEVRHGVPPEILDCVKKCATERESICEQCLQLDVASGKKILTAVFNGSAVPLQLEKNEFLKKVQVASR